MRLNPLVSWLGVAGLAFASGCAGAADGSDALDVGSMSQAAKKQDPCDPQHLDEAACGQTLFEGVLEGVPADNNRACATCHVATDALALSPATVQALPETDPLFNRIDADDPTAATPTYEHLKRGLVRVTLELPPNTDLIAVPPYNPDPQQNLELAAAFTNTYDASFNVQVGSARWWWNNLVVKGTHLCPSDRTPNEPPVFTEYGQQYEIVTPCDRKVSVWRAVPSVMNTVYTKPYLFDGRATTLEEQAEGALFAHSDFQGTPLPTELSMIAQFEQTLFSSDRAIFAHNVTKECLQLAGGAQQRACLATKPDPESIPSKKPTDGMTAEQIASWERGKALYDQTCIGCHGSPTDDRIMNRNIHDGLFPALDVNGMLEFDAQGIVLLDRPDDEFINIATTFVRYAGQLIGSALPPGAPNPVQQFASDVDFPKYRMRFYADDTRTQPVADMPPLPFVNNPTPENFLGAFAPAFDPLMGKLATGPNLANQVYSPDPGRALISGKYEDFEGFDVPQLRGIAGTAPYFHDNQSATLADVVTFYSQNVFPFIAGNVGLPVQNPPVAGVDTLTPEQKQDLVNFLQVF